MFEPASYFQKVAQHLKVLNPETGQSRFFRIRSVASLDELLASLPSASFPALMVHVSKDGMIGDLSKSDVPVDQPQLVFYVMDRATFGNEASVEAAINRCHQLANTILAKMLQHRSQSRHGLEFLDFSGISYQSVGPLGDHCFGMMYLFRVIQPIELYCHDNDWKSDW